jgi:hypothetical protein
MTNSAASFTSTPIPHVSILVDAQALTEATRQASAGTARAALLHGEAGGAAVLTGLSAAPLASGPAVDRISGNRYGACGRTAALER